MMHEATTIWENAHIKEDSDWIPDQDHVSITREDDASTSNSETSTNGGGHDELESNQLKQVEFEDEFGDTELEDLVKSEGLQEILQLILQEQANEFMKEEITDADDYADWIRWVSDAEQGK